ncbi:hypothetical protein, partial [Escherichia coli]|uniref:hypothetical protein n=1 Tax=Escherichia coli TaxID=562 RepID=UPI001BCA0A09
MSQTQRILAFDVLRLYLSPAGNALSIDAPSTCVTRNSVSYTNLTLPTTSHVSFTPITRPINT